MQLWVGRLMVATVRSRLSEVVDLQNEEAASEAQRQKRLLQLARDPSSPVPHEHVFFLSLPSRPRPQAVSRSIGALHQYTAWLHLS